jgi:diguanylate cyclase (GGDEF)-like protein/PAS domain S-box-containing protein
MRLDGTMLRINSAMARMNGFANEAELRAFYGEVIPNPYRDPERRKVFRALLDQHGQIQNFESEMLSYRSGQVMWVREHCHLVRDESGQAIYYEGTVEDITKEREATAALAKSETLLQNMLQTIPDRVWLKDTEGTYLTCNQAFADGLKTTPELIAGTKDTQWVGEMMAQRYLASDRLAYQANRTVHLEEPMLGPDGEHETLYEIVKTPLRGTQGEPIGVLCIARNIQQRKDAEALLRDTTEQLELAIIGADLGRWDHDLTLEQGYRMDERACQMLGRDPSESSKRRAWGHLIHPDDVPTALQAMRQHLSSNTPAYEAEYRARHTSGQWVWISSRGKIVQVSLGNLPQRMVGTVMDITVRKLAEVQLRATQAELQATLNALPDLLFEYSAEGHYRAVHAHDSADLITAPEIQLNRRIGEVLPADAAEVCLAALDEARRTGRSTGKQYSLELSRGKQWFELSVVRKPTDPGDEERFISIARNITERKQAEQAIAHLAFHDSLTQLPNRRMLQDRLQSAVASSFRTQRHGAVLFLDLDRFKELNDTYGHDAGDLLLQEVAQRLLQCIRAVDTVARLGGDEFVVLVQELSAEAEDARLHVATVGHKILDSLNEPYAINAQSHSITPSIGITLFLGKNVAPDDLLKQADQAMYHAKERGRNQVQFYNGR